MNKKYLMGVIGLMAVGFAAVSTTLLINGTAVITENYEDFNVYYSDARVNGVQDLDVVRASNQLVFRTTFDTEGQKYVLDYDVTNGSKNYDADLEMVCTGGNEYLSVTNEFDDETVLESLETRTGKLTIEMLKAYLGEDLEVNIECTIDATTVERESLKDEVAPSPIGDNYGVGRSIYLYKEGFNVIEETDTTVTLLAKYNLGTDYLQTGVSNPVSFADNISWDYRNNLSADVLATTGNVNTYLTNYLDYLSGMVGEDAEIDLITLEQLNSLGCVVSADHGWVDGTTCSNNKNSSWLVNGQFFWTKSISAYSNDYLWGVTDNGSMGFVDYDLDGGIRPVIKVNKEKLIEYLNTAK